MSDDGGSVDFDSAELLAIADVLAQAVPFNQLPDEQLAVAVRNIEISYHRQGERFTRDTPDKGLRIVRSGAVELRDGDNKLLDRLGEGESFHIEGLNARYDGVQAIAIEDCLIYLLPDHAYRALRAADRDFDRFFHGQRSRRLRRAARHDPAPNTLARPLRALMSRALVTVDPEQSVSDVATVMAERRVSSAFVVSREQLLGLVTDRDIRSRFAARGLPPTTPVRDIMTPEPRSMDAGASLFEATLLMTRHGFHHLPVTEQGKLAGIVTTSDLILARQDDPVYLVQHISRQTDVAGMRAVVDGIPNLMLQWVQSGIPPQQVSRVLTALSDAVTVRLIQLAEERLGPAPAAYCWLGFGSQGRGEQMLGSDQDNGLLLADEVAGADLPWFAQLAEFVCDGLAACGYSYCPGEIMASNRQWRQPLAAWCDAVTGWTVAPTAEAVMRVTIFFDLRAIHGDASLAEALCSHMLRLASSSTIFLAALAANALAASPPLGIFRRFVVERDGEHRDTLDLKKRGVLPVTDIVRLHALAHGIPAVNTDERLAALARARHLSITDSRNLADALHVIQRLRIRNQAEQVLEGRQPSNFLNPRDLPKLAREQLRDAFTVIDDAQAAVKFNYRQGLGA
jgi:CBS domain-containing protein